MKFSMRDWLANTKTAHVCVPCEVAWMGSVGSDCWNCGEKGTPQHRNGFPIDRINCLDSGNGTITKALESAGRR